MPAIPWRLIGAGVLAVILVVAVLAALDFKRRAETAFAAVAQQERCETAVRSMAIDPKALDACSAAVAQARVDQVAAARCDTALEKGRKELKPGGLLAALGIDQTCSTQVKTLVADRNARAGEAASHLAEIGRLRAARAGDIARAEQRAGDQQRRKADVEEAKRTAPAGADGRRVYRGDGLRKLLGKAAAGPAGQAGPGSAAGDGGGGALPQ